MSDSDVSDTHRHSVVLMGTVVTIEIVGHGSTDAERRERVHGVARALEWFREVETRCTRFDPESELRRATRESGVATKVSPLVFEVARFALSVADESAGAFDPTIGVAMERRGFDRAYHTGARVPAASGSAGVSYRDVEINTAQGTITVRRPLVLDLGAVAKGMAIDMAARELSPFRNFAIDAGGDVYVSGHNASNAPWAVGIRHPREAGALVGTLLVSDTAVCTSGDYERESPVEGGGHHIVDARSGRGADSVASATVMAQSAMVADALATAAFALGPRDGLDLLERQGVEGILITPTLERHSTAGMHLA